MPHYTTQQIDAANRMDIASFLMSRGEKLKIVSQQYLWETHQIWIDNNRWYTHYEAKGGYAVSFVMQYFGLSFQDSIRELIGETYTENKPVKTEPKLKKELILPKPNATMNRVYAYLMQERFISRDVITHFAHNKTLYEDEKYHNCVFVGLDEKGIPRHCHRRGTATTGKPFKLTEAGSQAEYSFHHDGTSKWLFVFEGPIDMLAFITLHKKEWQKHSYVALCSVSEKAVLRMLNEHPTIRKIVLCLDNDNAGTVASLKIKALLNNIGYDDVRILKPQNKDWDEDLKCLNGVTPTKAETDHTEEIRKLCHDYIISVQEMKQPSLLYDKVQLVYNALMSTGEHITKEQLDKYIKLLLFLAKDESRKCLEPIEWTELEIELIAMYIPYTDNGDITYRIRQISLDVKKLKQVYETPQISCNRQLFLGPILTVCMDAVRLLRTKFLKG